MYHVSRNGAQLGPKTVEEIKSLLASGQLNPGDLVWREGMAQWQPLATIPEIGVRSGPPPIPGGPAYVPPQSAVGPQGYFGARPSNSGMAVASLVLGILCLVTFWTYLPPLVFGLLAIIFGHISRANISNSQGRLSGAGLATGGLVTGYLGMFFTIAWIVFTLVFWDEILVELKKDPEFRRQWEEMQKQREQKH